MCTVTYLPNGSEGWIFTSNRDESPLRETYTPRIYAMNGVNILTPKDKLAGGSWIGVTENHKLGCVLNGAFKQHERKLPYRMSRGLILMDFLTSDNSDLFFELYDLNNIEPFTLIAIDNGKLFDFKWDGQNRYLSLPVVSKPHLWASATLYNSEWQAKRQKWFKDWLSNKEIITREDAINFHLNAGEGDPMNDLVMNRHKMVETISITSIEHHLGKTSILYKDLLTHQDTLTTMALNY